jgi:hypothetical protein
MVDKQPRPKARCPLCGTVSTYVEHINHRCVKLLDPNSDEPTRCEGRFRGAAAPEDWAECPACRGTGSLDGHPCPRCRGDGWLYRRAA